MAKSGSASASKGSGGSSSSSSSSKPSWGSPSSQSDWFDSVTGTTNAEREAWRENFNGGQPAGALGSGKSASDSVSKSESGWYAKTAFGASTVAPVVSGPGGPSTPPAAAQAPTKGAGQPVVQTSPTKQAGTGPGQPVVTTKPSNSKLKVTSGVPVFAPGASPPTKVHDGSVRSYGIGLGLTWEVPADLTMAQDWEDEVGDTWGIIPIGWNNVIAAGHNAGRLSNYLVSGATSGASAAVAPVIGASNQWLSNMDGTPGNYDGDRVNPFAVVQSPF